MDQATRKYIEQSLNIKLMGENATGGVIFNGSLNEAVIQELVSNVFTAVEWQDASSHDCGNDDGWLYIYLPQTDDVGVLLIGVDPESAAIYVS